MNSDKESQGLTSKVSLEESEGIGFGIFFEGLIGNSTEIAEEISYNSAQGISHAFNFGGGKWGVYSAFRERGYMIRVH